MRGRMYYGSNRYLCAVIEDMRRMYSTYNFSGMLSLIEEVQVLGNRMEGAIDDKSDLESLHDDIKAGKKELKQIRKEIKALQDQKETLEEIPGIPPAPVNRPEITIGNE